MGKLLIIFSVIWTEQVWSRGGGVRRTAERRKNCQLRHNGQSEGRVGVGKVRSVWLWERCHMYRAKCPVLPVANSLCAQ
jgi:hypothetical protein